MLSQVASQEEQAPTSIAVERQTLDANTPDNQFALRGFREWVFIAVICSSQYFVQGSLGYVLVPLHVIGRTFGQGPEEAASMAWHVGGFSLTVGTFILAAVKLGYIYGHKKLLCIGWTWFGIWSAVCGFAAFPSSSAFFSAARAVQGIGAALILPNALAIVGRVYPPGRKKQAIFAASALTAPLGCVTGVAIGAVFAQHIWWPGAIWLYAAGCLTMGVAAFMVIPADRVTPVSTKFDWLGVCLGVGDLLLLNISWNQAPIDGWSAPHVYMMLVAGFLLFISFFFQKKQAGNPILDLSMFGSQAVLVVIVTGLGWSSFGVWIYYTFQFIQNIRNLSPLVSDAQFVPEGVSGIAAALATPSLMRKVSRNWLMVIASASFFIGCLLQALAPVHQSYWLNTFWSFIIMAWGMDISFPASTTTLGDAVPPEHQGVSASLINTVVNYSIAIGIGIAGTVEAQVIGSGAGDLMGYRAALYSSTALAALGLLLALVTTLGIFPCSKPHTHEDISLGASTQDPQVHPS